MAARVRPLGQQSEKRGCRLQGGPPLKLSGDVASATVLDSSANRVISQPHKQCEAVCEYLCAAMSAAIDSATARLVSPAKSPFGWRVCDAVEVPGPAAEGLQHAFMACVVSRSADESGNVEVLFPGSDAPYSTHVSQLRPPAPGPVTAQPPPGLGAVYKVATAVEVCGEDLAGESVWCRAVVTAASSERLTVALETGVSLAAPRVCCTGAPRPLTACGSCLKTPCFKTCACAGGEHVVTAHAAVRRSHTWDNVTRVWTPVEDGRGGAGKTPGPLVVTKDSVPEPATTSREASEERHGVEDEDEDGEQASGEEWGAQGGDNRRRKGRPAGDAVGSTPIPRLGRTGTRAGAAAAAAGAGVAAGRPRRGAAAGAVYAQPAGEDGAGEETPSPQAEYHPSGRPRRAVTSRAEAAAAAKREVTHNLRPARARTPEWVRRSERPRKARTVTVRGAPVLISNLRDTDVVDADEGGGAPDWMDEDFEDDDGGDDDDDDDHEERSDEDEGEYDEELDDTDADDFVDGGRGRKRRRAAPAAAAAPRGKASKKRAVSGPEAKRLAHNRAMDDAANALLPVRESYLAQHLSLLRPWLDARALARLQRADRALCPEVQEYDLPSQIRAQLRPHQVAGFHYLANAFERGLHPILGDEMGLGKTLQTVCLLAHASFASSCGPHLVVCPLSVLQTWQLELHRWCPDLRVVRCHTSDLGERARLRDGPLRDPSSFDVALTTYEMLQTDIGDTLRSRLHWGCLVLDEGHRLKNEESLASQAVAKIHRRCTVLLTGTLLQNNMHELWALLQVCYPTVFTDSAPFDAAFDLGGNKQHVIDADALARARAMLRPLWLRRQKADVELNLPPKQETVVHCPLSAPQTALYRAALLSNAAILDADTGAGAADEKRVPNQADVRKMNHLCMQLRLLCGHPLLCTDEKDFAALGLDDEDAPVEALIAASGKLSVLDQLLQRLLPRGHRAVIFTQFTCVLDLLEEYCTKRGLPFARLDGSVCRARRQIDIMLFNRKGSPLQVFLASTRAGGLGINLQSADTCILYDSDWNPQADAQAMARVHRIGQTKPVAVFRLVTANTVEERIVARAHKKLYMDAVVARTTAPGDDADGGLGEAEPRPVDDADGSDSDSEAHQACAPRDASTLAADLRFGADALFKAAQGTQPTDEELDALCDRSPEGDARRAALVSLQAAGGVKVEALSEAPPPLTSYLGPQGAEMRRQALEAARAALEESKSVVGARIRTTTTVQIDGFAVKRSNMYGLEEGEPSVWDKEAAGGKGRPAAVPKRRVFVAGRDYGHSAWCQVCWEGGDLFCCSYCPATYHASCLGVSARSLERTPKWSCPHHECTTCGRKSAACGGILFRCESCAEAYCEDHLPEEVMDHGRIVDRCERWLRLGMTHQPGACFIHCSKECEEFAGTGFEGALEDNGEDGALPPWVQPGDDDVIVPPVAGAPGGEPLRGLPFTRLSRYLSSVYSPKEPLPGAPEDLAELALKDYPALDDDAYGAMYIAARDAVARNAPNRTAPPPPRGGAALGSKPSMVSLADGNDGNPDAGAQQAPGGAGKPPRRPIIRWSAEETAMLETLVAQHAPPAGGRPNWSLIFESGTSVWNSQRTVADIQVKWYNLGRKKREEEQQQQQDAAMAEPQEAAEPVVVGVAVPSPKTSDK